MSGSSGCPRQRLESILVDVEVSPAMLRRDPQGRTWLPQSAVALVAAEPECRDVLREFVDDELSLQGALEDPVTPLRADAFFTARVVDALPQAGQSPVRLSPRRRLALLGLFHLVGVALALMVVMMVPESTARWASSAHEVLSWGSDLGVGMWLAACGIGAALLLVLVGSRTHTPA